MYNRRRGGGRVLCSFAWVSAGTVRRPRHPSRQWDNRQPATRVYLFSCGSIQRSGNMGNGKDLGRRRGERDSLSMLFPSSLPFSYSMIRCWLQGDIQGTRLDDTIPFGVFPVGSPMELWGRNLGDGGGVHEAAGRRGVRMQGVLTSCYGFIGLRYLCFSFHAKQLRATPSGEKNKLVRARFNRCTHICSSCRVSWLHYVKNSWKHFQFSHRCEGGYWW